MEYKKKIGFIILAEVLLVGVGTSQKNIIDFTDGAYSNLLIAIDGDVPEDVNIITNLKTMFTSASQLLHEASGYHVYWKHIKILVPNTWSRQPDYQFARTETKYSANIIVHDYHHDEPFVDNKAGCGKEGVLMHMTPSYVLDKAYREEKFGSTDSVLVRNWGYLRWGLFKEHYDGTGSGTAPAYDHPGSGEEGTRCSLNIVGDLRIPNSFACQRQPNGKYPDDCKFVADETGQTATASLLFGTTDSHVHTINEFCNNELHNALAPNRMNQHCGGQSAWEVMAETKDFQDGAHPVTNTTPTFDVLQLSSTRSVVLVLDISGSMNGPRFERMIQSSTDYIMNVIPQGSQLGIVVFDTDSEILAPLTNITDSASRQQLVNALPPGSGGSTCIGCGIRSGIEVLGRFSEGGYLLLLSDGIENEEPSIEDTLTEIDQSGVIIDTITISNVADPQLEDLSTRTSGISSFCSDQDTGTCLIQAFQSTITERPDVGMEVAPLQIYSSEVAITVDSGFVVIPVVIDAALGNETVFTVIWTTGSSISVVIDGPDGTRIDENDSRYDIDQTTKIVSIRLPIAEPGVWNTTISAEPGVAEFASIAVTSKPNSQGYEPITLTVFLESREIDFSQTPAIGIYAEVRQGYEPVLNAEVTAIISDSYSATTTTPLLDNGSGSDLFKDDGTYSGYFLRFTSDGRYNVKVNVLGYDDVIVVTGKQRARRSAVLTSSEPSFMRTASGGVFKVQSYTENAADTLAPSRVQDLAYDSFSYDNSTVTLSWTAVGDDFDQGTAFRYELRYSTNYSEVRHDFSNSIEITQDHVVVGNLSLVNASGAIETITVTLPERGQDIVYYFAIRTWDEAGNVGDLSNVPSLSIKFIPLQTTEGPNLGLIIGLICAGLAVIAAVGLGVYIHRRKQERGKEGQPKSNASMQEETKAKDVEDVHLETGYDNPTLSPA